MKMYEIVLPPKSDSTCWIDDDLKMYHHMDKKHPYPYDEVNCLHGPVVFKNGLWDYQKPRTPKSFPTRMIFPLVAIKNDKIEFAKFLITQMEALQKDVYFDIQQHNFIFVHRQVNDYITVGCSLINATTDRPVELLDYARLL